MQFPIITHTHIAHTLITDIVVSTTHARIRAYTHVVVILYYVQYE